MDNTQYNKIYQVTHVQERRAYRKKRYTKRKNELCQRAKDYYKDHKDKVLQRMKKYKQRPEVQTRNKLNAKIRYKKICGTPLYKFTQYKSSAKQRAIPFNLTFEEFKSFWKKPCKYGCTISTIGLDRTNSDKGYTLDNVTPYCERHNKMKLDMSEHDFAMACLEVVNSYFS